MELTVSSSLATTCYVLDVSLYFFILELVLLVSLYSIIHSIVEWVFFPSRVLSELRKIKRELKRLRKSH